MQVLWSRAVQARSSCRCRSCLHSATTLARRSTTAASKRRLRVGDVFTAFYSTILATAAVADSSAKQIRTKEWDRVIADAKAGKPLEDLRPPEAQGPDGAEVRSNSGAIEEAAVEVRQEEPSILSSAVGLMDTNSSTRPSFLQKLDSLGHKLSRAEEYQELMAWEIDETRENIPVEEEEEDPDMPTREPQNEDELRQLSRCIHNLVQSLLATSEFYSSRNSAIAERSNHPRLQELSRRITSIDQHFERFPRPAYSKHSADYNKRVRKELQGAIRIIFNKTSHTTESIDLMIGKICYNLLISTVSPTIKIFNQLLAGFTKLKLHDLAARVVEAFWNGVLRPNKKTLELIIRHYTAIGDREGFRKMTRSMQGLEGDLMGNSVPLLDVYPKEVAWAARRNRIPMRELLTPESRRLLSSSRGIHRNARIIQRPKRDSHIFDALILGSLKLSGVRHATCYIRKALVRREKVESDTLCAVIKSCIDLVQTSSAIDLLLAILTPWRSYGDIPVDLCSSDLRLWVQRLMCFCGVDINLGSKGYLIRPLQIHYEIDKVNQLSSPAEALDRMVFHLRTSELKSALKQFSRCIQSVGDKLSFSWTSSETAPADAAGPIFSPSRADQALCILRNAQEVENQQKSAVQREKAVGRELRLKGLEVMTSRGFKRAYDMEMESELMIMTQNNEIMLEEMMDKLQSLEGISISQERLESLRLQVWLLSRQLAFIGAQFQLAWVGSSESWINNRRRKNWEKRVLVNIDARLQRVTEAYRQSHMAESEDEIVEDRPAFSSSVSPNLVDQDEVVESRPALSPLDLNPTPRLCLSAAS